MKLSSCFSDISAPATLNQCARASSDARPQRRLGRAEERDPVRALALRQEAQQDRNTIAGQELHPDAGQRAGGDEEAGVVLVARGRGANSLPPSHGTCTPAPGPSTGAWPGRRSTWHPAPTSLSAGIPTPLLSPFLLLPPLILALPHHTAHQQVTSRHIISQNRCEEVSPRSFSGIFLATYTKCSPRVGFLKEFSPILGLSTCTM